MTTGATELAVSIVCRGLAARALSDGAASAEGRAKGWLLLADAAREAARAALKPFLAIPVFAAGEKQSNRSWEWM